jgi:2-amino-4-hydroxy-6-hydroxymethyldihydropteridine diphosphokinase
MKAYIAVGSNIAPEENIKAALLMLAGKTEVTAVSTFYRTKAVGHENDPDYLNGVFEADTDIPPEKLKREVLKDIENALGRERSSDKFASRTIDLDLILFGDMIDENLKIPDPDIYRRDFIAFPLAELNPALVIPGTNESIKNILKNFKESFLKPEHEFTVKLKNILLIS